MQHLYINYVKINTIDADIKSRKSSKLTKNDKYKKKLWHYDALLHEQKKAHAKWVGQPRQRRDFRIVKQIMITKLAPVPSLYMEGGLISDRQR